MKNCYIGDFIEFSVRLELYGTLWQEVFNTWKLYYKFGSHGNCIRSLDQPRIPNNNYSCPATNGLVCCLLVAGKRNSQPNPEKSKRWNE